MRVARWLYQKKNWCCYSTDAVRELQRIITGIEQADSSPLHPAAYINLLQKCGSARAIAEGRRVYSLYRSSTLNTGASSSSSSTEEDEKRVKNHYIDMLGRSGCVEEARWEFDKLENHRDDYSWNMMIGMYTQTGHGWEALKLFWLMDLEGKQPTDIAFLAVLRACSCEELLEHGIRVQSRLEAQGLHSRVRIATAIQSMYGRCGRVEEARRLFEDAPVRDMITWNSLMSAYAQHGYLEEVVGLFRRMLLEGALASKATLISVLDACTRKRDLRVGKLVHSCSLEIGEEQDLMLATSLVNMYGKCGRFISAIEIFDNMPRRDLVAWNSIMQACCEHEKHREAFFLFGRMDLEGFAPNESTFMSLITACSSPAAEIEGEIIHRILLDSSSDVIASCYTDLVKGAVINMYTKCGRIRRARDVFDRQCFRDLISWTSLILAYAASGDESEAMLLFHGLDLEGLKPDRVAFLGALDACSRLDEGRQLHSRLLFECSGKISDMQVCALICMYSKCGSFEDARLVFEGMSMKNTSAFTAMASACSLQGKHKEGLLVFWRMELEGLRPSEVTFVSVLEACAGAPDLKQGRSIHNRVGVSSSELLCNSIVNMYGKCGSLGEARSAFERIPSKTVVSWSTLIGAYTHHGHVEDATELFLVMQLDGFHPDDVIFVSILSACSHAGLFTQSRAFFLSMAGSYGVCLSSEHYGCILDVLGRSGRLEEAEDLISNMPYEPTGLQWMSLMCACKTHDDVDRALRIAELIREFLTPDKVAQACMMLSNMFSARGRFADAEKMRAMALAAQAGHQHLSFEELLKCTEDNFQQACFQQ